MQSFTFILALGLALLVLWEIFETIVLPRKIDRRFRLTRYYYLAAWNCCCFFSDRIPRPKVRSAFLSIFGPLSLLGLFAVWGISLVFAFALMTWSIHSEFKLPDGEASGFAEDLYVSGTTLTTLGLGDVTPRSPAARLATVVEAGLGLGLVALVISYLPALYQAFSRREADISLLDARAGSPPSATELLRRSATGGHAGGLETLLANWERWCAEIMESHISYPVLCYFRSQHTNQNWVTAITAVLDTCAFCIACLEHESSPQARLTFAMGRHAVVDITQVFHKKPSADVPERLSLESFKAICDDLRRTGLQVRSENESWMRLEDMRRLYEPYVATLGRHLRMDLAPWVHPSGIKDNWVATKWQSTGITAGH
jgi:voltage-gated potassium channel Kch